MGQLGMPRSPKVGEGEKLDSEPKSFLSSLRAVHVQRAMPRLALGQRGYVFLAHSVGHRESRVSFHVYLDSHSWVQYLRLSYSLKFISNPEINIHIIFVVIS